MSSTLRSCCLILISLLFAFSSAAFVPSTVGRRTACSVRTWGTRPAVLVRESTSIRSSSGPSIILERQDTIERTTTKEPTRDRKQHGNEAWEVRIYNDGLNTREHVARSLVQVTGLTEMIAYQTMMTAHQNGIAVVGRWAFEIAEMYHDELKRNGIVCDIVPVDDDER